MRRLGFVASVVVIVVLAWAFPPVGKPEGLWMLTLLVVVAIGGGLRKTHEGRMAGLSWPTALRKGARDLGLRLIFPAAFLVASLALGSPTGQAPVFILRDDVKEQLSGLYMPVALVLLVAFVLFSYRHMKRRDREIARSAVR